MKTETREEQLVNFAHNVSRLRKQYGLSKKEMVKLLEISVYSLNKIENGELPLNIGVKILFNVKKHFGINIKDQLEKKLMD